MDLSISSVQLYQRIWKVISKPEMFVIKLENDIALVGATGEESSVLLGHSETGWSAKATLFQILGKIALATVLADAYEDSRANPFVRRYFKWHRLLFQVLFGLLVVLSARVQLVLLASRLIRH